MKANRIFKTLALPMAAAMMLLSATSCSSDENMSEEPTNKVVPTKGYAIPVTVKVNRQGDSANGTTRATYDSESKTLSFSAGDQLFIKGTHEAAGAFAGTLTYSSTTKDVSTFEGTIYAEHSYTGTADDLLKAATTKTATLLPNGYSTYGYLSVSDAGTYSATLSTTATKAIVAGDKALGVEQLSLEQATTYSSGFSLTPQNAILKCTISGLTASKAYTFTATDETNSPAAAVTADASGVATFVVAFTPGATSKTYAISTGDDTYKAISLGEKTLTAGYIYNVNKVAIETSAVDLANLTAAYEAQDGAILTGTLGAEVKISIADGATVTLKDASINAHNEFHSTNTWAGITCMGSATINLEGTNTVKGFNSYRPGIRAGGSGTTLTIQSPSGTGKLIAGSGYSGSGNDHYATGIGCYVYGTCGDITITSGIIQSTGGVYAAGIGCSWKSKCGIITISGGTVTATGGGGGAGIGTGCALSCATTCAGVIISGGTVTATGGNWAAGIGAGYASGTDATSTCGYVMISGGTVTATGGGSGAGIGAGKAAGSGAKSTCGFVAIESGAIQVVATKGDGDTECIGKGANESGGTSALTGDNVYDNQWADPPITIFIGSTGGWSEEKYCYDTEYYYTSFSKLCETSKSDGFTWNLSTDGNTFTLTKK